MRNKNHEGIAALNVAHNDTGVSARPKLPRSVKLFFGCGQAVEATVSIVINTFLLFYLTSVCGLAPSLAGTIIFLSLVVDAIADPAIGAFSDRFKSRWGRRLPFMVVAIPIICVSVLSLFMIPTGLPLPILIGLILFLNASLRLGISLFALPYSALTAELTADYDERSSLAVYRMSFAFLGSVVCIAPAFWLIFDTRDAYADRSSYLQLGSMLCGIVVLCGGLSSWGLRRSIIATPAELAALQAKPQPFFANLRDIFRSRSFMILLSVSVVVFSILGSTQALSLYVYRDYFLLPASATQVPILGFQAGTLAGIPMTAWLLVRVEKRIALSIANSLLAAAQCFPVIGAYLLGLTFPSTAATALLALSTVLAGIAFSMGFVCFQSMIADSIDEHELRFGQRCEALYYSAVVFAGKAAVGIGSLIAGLVLGLVGIGGSSTAREGLQLTKDQSELLGWLWGLGHGLFFLAVVPVVMMMYRLDRNAHASILSGLASRRSQASSS